MSEGIIFLRGDRPPLIRWSDRPSQVGVFPAPNLLVVADSEERALELDGCFAKLDRAQEHLATIDDAVRAFIESDPYGALGEVEGEQGWYVLRVKVRRQPPIRLGVLIGEYVHQIRSGFDHFLWALAAHRLAPKTAPNRLNFPIDTSPAKYARKAHRLAEYVGAEWAAFIEALQPYSAQHDTLAIIERFWNRDKHQVLVPLPLATIPIVRDPHVAFLPDAASGEITKRRPRTEIRLVDGAEIARVKLSAVHAKSKVDMYCCRPAHVLSQGGEVGGYLSDLTQSEQILRCILAAFPTGRRDWPPWRVDTYYGTVVSTLDSDAAITARGFALGARWRPEPAQGLVNLHPLLR